MPSTLRPRAVLAMLLLALATAQSPTLSAQTSLSRFVTFGTSLSDPGNAFALSGEASRPPYATLDAFLVPGAPYEKGGHHFSNGSTWIELLAAGRGRAASAHAAFAASNWTASNFAVGGARAREDGHNLNFGIQVGAFTASVGGSAPADAFYVVEIGGNDVRDALVAYAFGGDGAAVLGDALTATGTGIHTLYQAGARTFIVWNVPDIGLTPAVRALDAFVPGTSTLASLLTSGYNANLAALTASLEATHPGMVVLSFDAFSMIHAMASSPAFYGLSNANTPCVTPGVPPYDCDAPEEYLFWDGIHPTKAVHSILAEQVALLLGP